VGVVCQPRPVYAALYFVLITLAGAGIFVLLLAEFMAIVLIIIYAGAILVTYVFVIMLASQGSTGGNVAAPAYDRRASGALSAVFVAFVLAGSILQVLLPTPNPDYKMASASGPIAIAGQKAWRDIAESRAEDKSVLQNQAAELMVASLGMSPVKPVVASTLPATTATATNATTAAASPREAMLPSNVQVIGTSLYSQYSFSLELAGVLLTIALIGAVVIARKGSQEHQPLGSGQLPAE